MLKGRRKMANIIRLIGSQPFEVSISAVEPPDFSLRVSFEGEEGELEELGGSMLTEGQMHVIDVIELGNGKYRCVAGERRLKAAKKVNAATVWVRAIDPRNEADTICYQLQENIQRKQLDPYEEALAFNRLLELGFSIPDIAKKAGKRVYYVRSKLQFLDAAPGVHEFVVSGDITPDQAALIARLSEGEEQVRIAHEAVRDNLTTPQIRSRVEQERHSPNANRPRRVLSSGKVVTEAWRIIRWLDFVHKSTNFKFLSGPERKQWAEVFGSEIPTRLNRILSTMRNTASEISSPVATPGPGNVPDFPRNFGTEWPADHIVRLEKLNMKDAAAVGALAKEIGRTPGALHHMRKLLRKKKKRRAGT